MKKSISISIRVSEEELDKFKQAARLEAYASYSEFVRRTALIEASKIIKEASENRERADYLDFYIASKKDAEIQLAKAERFQALVMEYLKNKGIY